MSRDGYDHEDVGRGEDAVGATGVKAFQRNAARGPALLGELPCNKEAGENEKDAHTEVAVALDYQRMKATVRARKMGHYDQRDADGP